MDIEVFDKTQRAAYFLWEFSGCGDALKLWYCVEDIACFFEQGGYLRESHIREITGLSVDDPGYVAFVRHVAFRVYIYTNNDDADANWFIAERLLRHKEWAQALADMAAAYRGEKNNRGEFSEVRSENVRAYYDEQTLHNG